MEPHITNTDNAADPAVGSFPGRLLNALHTRKVLQVQLARRLGVARSTVSNWIRADSTPNPDTIRKIADELSVTADYLVGRRPEMSPHAVHAIAACVERANEQLSRILIELAGDQLTPPLLTHASDAMAAWTISGHDHDDELPGSCD